MESPGPRRGIRLLEVAGLVVAYALAAGLLRAFWPAGGLPSTGSGVVLGILYLWLGLAMGGPLVLLIDRRSRPSDPARPGASRFTWAETAWILIGGYWLGMAVLVVPSPLPVNPLFGVFPIVGAVLLRAFSPKADARADRPGPAWTHATAVAVLVTWPIAWGTMILLAKTLL